MEVYSTAVLAPPERVIICRELKADSGELHIIVVWTRMFAVAAQQGLGL